MKKFRHLFSFATVLVFAFLFWGSTTENMFTEKKLSLTGGNRNDGTMTFSYEYHDTEFPKVNWEDAKQKAIDKCKSWGFKGVEFYKRERRCMTWDSSGGCTHWNVTYNAQCTLDSPPEINKPNESDALSGTGVAISSDGIIVTNQHVIDGSTKILVRGVNGDFSKAYLCEVLQEDKQNDLALLKITDSLFTKIDSIPFVIYDKSKNIGSSVFCLGYPLKATIGDQLKLSNGIISSKSGYEGDISSYQLTIAVQPGNSGAPLFDDSGFLVGIINTKHSDAENVSFAKKSTFLLDFIDIIPNKIDLPQHPSLMDRSLPELVQKLQNYVYIIEVAPKSRTF